MRLFVIGADPRRERAFSTWLRAGLSVTLADGVTAGCFEHAVDRFHPVEVRDERADVESLVRMAAGHDGVIALAEGSLVTAATVARELGLPGPGVGAARIARSKIRQRETGERHGLTGPRHAAVTGPDDLVRFFAAGVQAAVLKPADASASASVFAVQGVEEALDRWPQVRAISPSRTGIVEEYLPGAEASVEAVVRDGETVFSSLTRKQTGGPTGFLEVAHTTDRADRPDTAVNALVRDLIAAWRVESAILHVEAKLDDDRPVLLEATVRPAGDYITELVSVVHGRDLYLDQAHLALGQPLAPDGPARARRAEVRFLLASGTVRRNVAPVEVLDGLTNVKIVRQLVPAGSRIPPLTANWARAGYAIGWSADDGESLTGQLRAAVSDLGKLMGTPELT